MSGYVRLCQVMTRYIRIDQVSSG